MAGQGSFAGFMPDPEQPDKFGWKTFSIREVQKQEGSRAHAYCEKNVLEWMSQHEELAGYIAKVEKAEIYINGRDASEPGVHIPRNDGKFKL